MNLVLANPQRRALGRWLAGVGALVWAGAQPGARAQALASAAPAAGPGGLRPPPSAQLDYGVVGRAKGFGFEASARLDWLFDAQAGRYQAELLTRMPLLGSRRQHSQGTVDARGLAPERFSDQRRHEALTLFEAAQGRIRFQPKPGAPASEAPWLPGVQDRLSLFFQLAARLNGAEPRPEGKRTWSMPVAGSSSTDVWLWRGLGMEALDLPAGPVSALHLSRRPREPGDAELSLWFDPARGHLPVRILLRQGEGEMLDQRLLRWP